MTEWLDTININELILSKVTLIEKYYFIIIEDVNQEI